VIPLDELIVEEVTAFFSERLSELDGHLSIELNVTSNSSPGAVLTGGGPTGRERWFAPRSSEDLRERRRLLANDTSLGTGWAPQSRVGF
jgi:S-adenosylmethionine synthetase